jgi:hypothetical protein
MAELELRLFIRATPERVWSILSDLEGQVSWMIDLHSLEITSGQKSGAGTVVKATTKLFGLPIVNDLMEITVWDEPRELAVVHRGQFTGTAYFRIEAVPGGCVFTWYEQFKPPLGSLGELGFRWLVGPHLRRVFSRSMENVRQMAERQSSITYPSGSLT